MTEFFQAFWLAALQGLTEFLPISSSGHLALAPRLLGWPDQGLAFDVATHFGTLLAVLGYFRADVGALITAWCGRLAGRPATAHTRLAWSILYATALVGATGLLFGEAVQNTWRAPLPVAAATLLFGALLGAADHWAPKERPLAQLNWRDVLIIGAAQTLALAPGVSRAGITLSAARLMGFTRTAAARFSFLLAIPVIAMASAWQARALLIQPATTNWGLLLFATAVAAVVAWLCIHWFLGFVQRHSLLPFALYRVALGALLLWVFW